MVLPVAAESRPPHAPLGLGRRGQDAEVSGPGLPRVLPSRAAKQEKAVLPSSTGQEAEQLRQPCILGAVSGAQARTPEIRWCLAFRHCGRPVSEGAPIRSAGADKQLSSGSEQIAEAAEVYGEVVGYRSHPKFSRAISGIDLSTILEIVRDQMVEPNPNAYSHVWTACGEVE